MLRHFIRNNADGSDFLLTFFVSDKGFQMVDTDQRGGEEYEMMQKGRIFHCRYRHHSMELLFVVSIQGVILSKFLNIFI